MHFRDWLRPIRPRRALARAAVRRRRPVCTVPAATLEGLETRVLLCGGSDQDPDYVPPPQVGGPPGETIVDYYAPVDTYVLTMSGTGFDITYEVVSGNDDGALKIDAATGEMTVAEEWQDRSDSDGIYDIVVRVTDGCGQTAETTTTVNFYHPPTEAYAEEAEEGDGDDAYESCPCGELGAGGGSGGGPRPIPWRPGLGGMWGTEISVRSTGNGSVTSYHSSGNPHPILHFDV